MLVAGCWMSPFQGHHEASVPALFPPITLDADLWMLDAG
jgi:hypothetical protein